MGVDSNDAAGLPLLMGVMASIQPGDELLMSHETLPGLMSSDRPLAMPAVVVAGIDMAAVAMAMLGVWSGGWLKLPWLGWLLVWLPWLL